VVSAFMVRIALALTGLVGFARRTAATGHLKSKFFSSSLLKHKSLSCEDAVVYTLYPLRASSVPFVCFRIGTLSRPCRDLVAPNAVPERRRAEVRS
jgi:hypothetical protein